MGRRLEFALGVLNGAVGNYLARTDNGLAIAMSLIHQGAPLRLERAELHRAYPQASGRLVLLVHGLMCNEDIFRFRDGSDYGSKLAAELGLTPVYVRYNSGLPIPDNGAALARLLDSLVAEWPVPVTEIIPLGYSMGGLLVRSACHMAATAPHSFLPLLRRAIYLGTPHRGAPMERAGRVLAKALGTLNDPYTRLLADLANLRSDGVQDLGDADLTHEHRGQRSWVELWDKRHPIPLLPDIKHYLLAASLSVDATLSALFGDVVVPVRSATNGQLRTIPALPPERVKVLTGLTHVGLAHNEKAYAQILAWCQEDP